jgi:hypothetical protein
MCGPATVVPSWYWMHIRHLRLQYRVVSMLTKSGGGTRPSNKCAPPGWALKCVFPVVMLLCGEEAGRSVSWEHTIRQAGCATCGLLGRAMLPLGGPLAIPPWLAAVASSSIWAPGGHAVAFPHPLIACCHRSWKGTMRVFFLALLISIL